MPRPDCERCPDCNRPTCGCCTVALPIPECCAREIARLEREAVVRLVSAGYSVSRGPLPLLGGPFVPWYAGPPWNPTKGRTDDQIQGDAVSVTCGGNGVVNASTLTKHEEAK